MPKFVNRSGLIASVLAALSALALFSAGCNEECKKGKSECVDGTAGLIRTCVATADSNEWLITSCPDNSVCSADAEELAAKRAGADAGGLITSAQIDGSACVGTCLQGDRSCASDALARVCVADGTWELDACDLGEKCIDGACQVSNEPGTVLRCEPGAKACASETMEKVCDPDGTAWTTTACLPSEVCTDTECVPDPKSSCDDASTCLDNKTAIRCLGQGEGFELVPCEGDTYCEFGRCRGTGCALGSICNGTTATGLPLIRECADGVNFTDTVCGANEACQQDKDSATCVPLECAPGTTVCGDPRDPAVDPTTTFTTCVVNGAGSGVPEWVTGTCDGATTCDPTILGGFPTSPCAQLCTPGAERCGAATGIAFGKQVCLDDGTWGKVTSCNAGTDSELQCVIAPTADASKLPKALCADPICAYALTGPADGATGYCEEGKLRECLPDGTIAKAKDCGDGVCLNTGSAARADGRSPGACQTTPVCQDGQSKCAVGTGLGSMFQTCENGFWSTKLTSCDTDGTCWNVLDTDGNPSHQCGGECAAGTRQCDPTDATGTKVQTCSSKGKYGTAEPCDIGFCQGAGGDATCRLQCVPNTLGCVGTTVAAPDGTHTGTSQQAKCGDDGTWGAPTACAAGTACRTGASGEPVGCVQCVGEDVVGGNENGVMDTRCDPAAVAKLQECGPDNKWDASRTCGESKTCLGTSGPTCGFCTSAQGWYVSCNATSINDNEMCGSCNVTGYGFVTNCTESSIAATGGTGTLTCEGQGYTAGSSFGGFADCCGGAHRTGTRTCDDVQAGSVPTVLGGVANCCSHSAVVAGGGFAYCQ